MRTKLLNPTELTLDHADRVVFLHRTDKLSDLLDKVERQVYEAAITRCKGNQVVCSQALGVSRGTLRTKLKKYFGNKYFSQEI